ncbi:flagellar biosynthetic protein FliQ [Buchnera aphidicola]|uniref:flagellar biosynthetic protein FliQ n=1 Tax=Buchnera aphidicola TaxID=9 RepID=UPI003463F670
MEINIVKILFYESLKVLLILSFPILFSILFVGVIISVFQAATQIHEQTLAFIPKIIILFIILLFFGSWMLNVMLCYMQYMFKSIIFTIFYFV